MANYWIMPVAFCLVLVACERKSPAYHPETPAENLQIAETVDYQPDRDLEELFVRVQMEKLYPDSKTFVDATPLFPPADILADYRRSAGEESFDMAAFVASHFRLPDPLPAINVDVSRPLREHLQHHWDALVREASADERSSTLIPLPQPYVVPGGRFREMFYWDSYFTLVGLMASGRDTLAKQMIDNFAYLIDRYGYIPNGNRTYFLGRSQPPFFAASLQLYANKHGMESVIGYLPLLEREYRFWMDGQSGELDAGKEGKHLVTLANGDFLNRYYGSRSEPRAEAYNKEYLWAEQYQVQDKAQFFRDLRAACESGWDFSSRWFADGQSKASINTHEIIPVDLSSLMYSMEITLARMYEHRQDQAKSAFYRTRAVRRQQLIEQYHFDPVTGTYQDYNYVAASHTGQLSLAMLFPLFFGVAGPDNALGVVKVLEQQFLKPGGLVTSLRQSGEQWDYPNGWAPLQYVAVEGLAHYGYDTLARDIARRWLALNERVYREEGKMMEKYNVVDTHVKAGGGNYPNQDGFGWTNGVALAFYEFLDSPIAH
ncbi:alpha,alpha-trehalase TreF [Cellvibrio japonicus]|uniref:Trehalase, putative, tre37B n=1 Tax=Cellvibrio japonicus (strain Ueda107) TaxID=498211 RepID=B3PHJ9_CELJU|nr:alpha,alpha-trehalase TreF [Cellvibrio japonicus]ACE85234.1 trehalase, putative, tre37B [Cellvibrio japonicus Ueda107]